MTLSASNLLPSEIVTFDPPTLAGQGRYTATYTAIGSTCCFSIVNVTGTTSSGDSYSTALTVTVSQGDEIYLDGFEAPGTAPPE